MARWHAVFTGGAECSNSGSSQQLPGEESPADPPTTVFPHSETSRLWVSGQMNFIEQWHPSFHSPYQGPLSLTPQGEHALSRVFTLFTGVELTGYAEALFQLESAGGERDWQWLRARRIYQSGCRSQSFAGFKTVCKANDAAFCDSVEPRRTLAQRNPLSVFRE